MKTFVILLVSSIALASEISGQSRRQIASVPDINGRATLLVRPDLPGDALIAADGTTVTLRVVVDENGNALSAKCSLTCPDKLRLPAESAAMASKFAPLVINGKPVRYEGILLYSFSIQQVNWFALGLGLQSVYIFDNLSLGPVAALLTSEYSEEKTKLSSLDAGVDLNTRFRTIETVVRSLSSKLQGTEAWMFSLGLTMRRLSAPFQSDRGVNREELQKALSEIGKFCSTAPAEIDPGIIDVLKEIAAFKIDESVSNEELRLAIFKLTSKVRFESDKKVR